MKHRYQKLCSATLILSCFYFDGILGAGLLANFNFTEFWKRDKFLFIIFKISEPKPKFDILGRFPQKIRAIMAKIKLPNKPHGMVIL